MIASSEDLRVRRPQQHEAMMLELQDEARFPTLRDVLIFGAAVGYANGRRASFTAASEPIRYGTVFNPGFSETLMNMIAANVAPDDPEIMDAERIEERIKIFEEYANGGLEYIQEQVNTRHQPAALVVLDLVTDALSEAGGAEPASVDELLSGATWG